MKTITYSITILLLISSIAAIGLGQHATIEEHTTTIVFSEPTLTTTNTYLSITIPEATTCIHTQGKPMLPIHTTKLTLPFGTHINSISCTPDTITTQHLPYTIQPAPNPVLRNGQKQTTTYTPDQTIYTQTTFYPNTWYTYTTGGGLDENHEHKTFLIIHTYPVQYAPATNTIQYTNQLTLKITYTIPPQQPQTYLEDYDLLIIAPQKFVSTLEPLATHKTSHGITTQIKTTESIYDEYTGVDKPEQIKYAIKDAVETANTKYVLLVGGMKSLITGTRRDDANQGTQDWYVPVRYTNLQDSGSTYDPGYISDLYYADIYDGEGNFSSWDSNSDGIFAKWYGVTGKDIIDLYPDVYVGRLACRNKYEVKLMVNKIIDYETGTAGTDWYNRMIVVGGDSHEDGGTNYVEGEEVENQVMSTTMTEFTAVKLYASYKDTDPDHTPTTANIVREISAGAGHLLFDGHASPARWNTHYPGEFDSWVGGIRIYDFPKLRNKEKLPVCVVGGCHNSQFNVTLISTLTDPNNTQFTWTHGSPTPECWSWWLTRKIGGGAIATLGNTGLGYGTVGEHGDLDGDNITEPDCVEGLGGYQEIVFYEAFDEGFDILGETWGMAESKYLDTFPGMNDQTDCKTVQQWALLGDPSLKIGGYAS